MLNLTSGRRYEVAARRDGRWLIDCLARSEGEARARADELYRDEAIEAVRVVRARFGNDGTSFESVLFEQERPKQKGAAPVRIAGGPSDAAWCETLDDLYGRASRRAIARLLRNFLDRYGITPTELLHHHRYMRMLERQDNLQTQAVQRMASIQAKARGIEPRLRADAIDRFVADANTRARDALASRAAPRLGPDGIEALVTAIADLAKSDTDRAFYLRFALSVAWETNFGPADKLAMAGTWASAGAALVPLIDEIASGLLGAAALIQEVLGAQSHLAGALGTLADLALGHEVEKVPPAFAAFAPLFGAGSMPETRLVLIERIERELGSEKSLSRDDATTQRRQFETLLEKLVDADGFFAGSPAMIEAIARRSRRLEIIGGVETIRFRADSAAGRLEELLVQAADIIAERQQRAVGTYFAALLDELGDDEAVAACRPRIASLPCPDALKSAMLARLPA
ncbi:MAG TPA: hypothetical protein VLV50_09095 [Stellaceae bacterium]|nr:hypothetical protein [Stellaceae bacterium]